MEGTKKSTKKSLFGDDDLLGTNDGALAGKAGTLGHNKEYAQKFETVKRKGELQKLSNKYGNDAADSEDSEETEDSDGDLYDNPQKDHAFADVLYKLKTKDPSIMDRNKRFFDGLDQSSSDEEDAMPTAGGKKKYTMADEYRKRAVTGDDAAHVVVEDEQVTKALKRGPTDARQAAQKAAFLAASSGQAVEEDDASLFTKKKQKEGGADAGAEALAFSSEEMQKSKRKKIKKAFKAGASDVGLTEDEAFLANFFAEQNWAAKEDEQGAPKNYNLEQVEADEQDEAFYDEAEIWEQEYQQQKYRHEEGEEATHIETFPREQDGLLRQKDTTRKDARERKKEREDAEQNRALEELKRLKHLKKMEIDDQRTLIAEVAGLGANNKKKKASAADSNFAKAEAAAEERMKAKMASMDLTGDWDEAKHAKMMADMFGEDYYGDSDDDLSLDGSEMGEEDNELMAATAKFDELDDDEVEDELPMGYFNDNGDEDLDALYPTAAAGGNPKDSDFKKGAKVSKPLGPNGETVGELKENLHAKVDEYNKLHYDSVMKGGLKTRFRYSEVNQETFGMTDEDILTTDDRSLNMTAPMNCYATYLSKDENLKDRYKSMHRAKNLRTLPAERKTRRYKADTVVFNAEIDESEGEKIAEATEVGAVKIANAIASGGKKRTSAVAIGKRVGPTPAAANAKKAIQAEKAASPAAEKKKAHPPTPVAEKKQQQAPNKKEQLQESPKHQPKSPKQVPKFSPKQMPAQPAGDDQPAPVRKQQNQDQGQQQQRRPSQTERLTGQKRSRDESHATSGATTTHHQTPQQQQNNKKDPLAFLARGEDGAPAEKKPRLEGAAFRMQKKMEKAARLGLPMPTSNPPQQTQQPGQKKYYGKKEPNPKWMKKPAQATDNKKQAGKGTK